MAECFRAMCRFPGSVRGDGGSGAGGPFVAECVRWAGGRIRVEGLHSPWMLFGAAVGRRSACFPKAFPPPTPGEGGKTETGNTRCQFPLSQHCVTQSAHGRKRALRPWCGRHYNTPQPPTDGCRQRAIRAAAMPRTTASGGSSFSPRIAPRPVKGQEGRRGVKPPECRVAGQLAQILVAGSSQGRRRRFRRRTRHRSHGRSRRHVRGPSHSFPMNTGWRVIRCTPAGFFPGPSGERCRTRIQEARDKHHEPGRVREPEENFNGTGVRHGPQLRPEMAVA